MGAGGADRQRRDGGGGGGADADLYAVLGLSRECTDADLRLAYRKLAMVNMASGQVLGGRRQLGGRRRGQGALPGDPGRLLRALRLQQAVPLRRRRLRRRRSRSVGDGRLPRRDGADDEPGDACGELRGVAAAVRGYVPRRHRRRPLPVDAAVMAITVFPSAAGDHQCTVAGGGFTQGREQAVFAGDGHGLQFGRPGHFGLLFQGSMDVAGREHRWRRRRRRWWQEEEAEADGGEPRCVAGCSLISRSNVLEEDFDRQCSPRRVRD